MLNSLSDLLRYVPTQRSDRNVWVTFVIFQPIADAVDNICLDGALERFKKFAVGNVLIQPATQKLCNVVYKSFARLLNQGGVRMEFELFVYVGVMRASGEIER